MCLAALKTLLPSAHSGHFQPSLCSAEDLASPFPLLMQLLDYVTTALLFSDKNVDSNLVTWNRVVLLHGERFGFV